jgi:hypothetical protein
MGGTMSRIGTAYSDFPRFGKSGEWTWAESYQTMGIEPPAEHYVKIRRGEVSLTEAGTFGELCTTRLCEGCLKGEAAAVAELYLQPIRRYLPHGGLIMASMTGNEHLVTEAIKASLGPKYAGRRWRSILAGFETPDNASALRHSALGQLRTIRAICGLPPKKGISHRLEVWLHNVETGIYEAAAGQLLSILEDLAELQKLCIATRDTEPNIRKDAEILLAALIQRDTWDLLGEAP